MPKAKKSDTEAVKNTIARYALERAGKAVSALGDVELAPGSYPFALDVSIAGELLVEQGTPPGEPQTIADIKPVEVLAGLVASVPDAERKRVISAALGEWKNASPEARKAMLADADAVVLTAAKARRMTTETAPTGRKGAVKCKPSVTITGTAGAQKVSVKVAAA
jgi:hypothetical protein